MADMGRIIPALAGNTFAAARRRGRGGDHPRSRGEYAPQGCNDICPEGSSPLSRGIPCIRPDISVPVRIIPALAGNTLGHFTLGLSVQDHPRSRGEYCAGWCLQECCYGSSPLSRGIRHYGQSGDRKTGIIPALAGNTGSGDIKMTRGTDHPRSRGEYAGTVPLRYLALGSSPLSRGIRSSSATINTYNGIIPALAGNTF